MSRWNERYREPRYFYGTEPNRHVARALAGIPPGRALFLAEGEGRNAVHAAALGHAVTAVDSSVQGRRKALQLAASRGVELTYELDDVFAHPWTRQRWDTVVLCFAHFLPDRRRELHRRAAAALRPGGWIILQSFALQQHGRASGGPPDRERLQDIDEIRGEFPGVVWTEAVAGEEMLAEGVGHRGLAAVNSLVGVKSDA
jgi:hypothetical protein